jgi:hypothetical protein
VGDGDGGDNAHESESFLVTFFQKSNFFLPAFLSPCHFGHLVGGCLIIIPHMNINYANRNDFSETIAPRHRLRDRRDANTLRISLRNNVLRHSLLGAGTARPRGINLEYKFVYKMPGFPPAP